MDSAELIAQLVVSLLSDLFSGAISLVFYILMSLALYTIAQRRGIRHAWLAWIPVASVWILGSIADDYRMVARGEKKNRRTALVILQIALAVLATVFVVMFLVVLIGAGAGYGYLDSPGFVDAPSYELGYIVEGSEPDVDELEAYMAAIMGMGTVMFLFGLLIIGISIACGILRLICLYDVFESCDPKNKLLYFLLSFFMGLEAVFLFVCRNKDLGMYPAPAPVHGGYVPPRYQQPPYGQAQYQPYQPPRYQPPVYQPPQYQPPVYQPPQYQLPQPAPQATEEKQVDP